MLKSLLFHLITALKCKRRDADYSDMTKRRQKVLPISEKVKLDLIRKRKRKLYAKFSKIYCKSESLIHEIVKKKK